MKPMRTRRRWKLLAELCGLAAVASLPVAADAQAVLPLFDGHIHYSVGAARQYSPEQIVGILDQAGIRRALLSSTPNDGTRELFRLYPRRFIPELRPYRKTRDLASWSDFECAGRNHFDIILDLADSATVLGRRTLDLIRSTAP